MTIPRIPDPAPHGTAVLAHLAGPPHGFAFQGPGGSVTAAGRVTALPHAAKPSHGGDRHPDCQPDTLADRLARAFASAPRGALVGGALPFAPGAPDALWLAHGVDHAPLTAAAPQPQPACLSIVPQPSAADYAASVARALDALGDPQAALDKVVLARTLDLRFARDVDQAALLAALAVDPAATAFRVALPGGRSLIGATPELLVSKSGAQVRSFPLAGSARRHPAPVPDAAACAALAASAKDLHEHAMVVEAIMDTLSPLCRSLSAPEGTGLTATRSMWHLGTRIEGTLRDPATPAAVLAAALHPTPAVCGHPRRAAADLIARLEPVDRGYYAGAVGWCDAQGDGAWHVAIRCAEIDGATARLFAGAGIVPGSDPAAETAETAAKFGAMLAALGLPADAVLAPPQA